MIIDTLENAGLYANLNKHLAKALHYLQTTNLSALEKGKHEVDGDAVFALVSEYDSKRTDEVKWEAHKSYTDVQMLISGEEKMGYAPLQTMEVTEPYNPEQDVAFFKGTGNYVVAKPGAFVVFFPQDVHQPCIAINNSIPIKKVVMKVKM